MTAFAHLLLAAAVAASATGQSATAPTPSRTGASPSRANGVAPNNGTGASPAGAVGSTRRSPATRSKNAAAGKAAPARAENDKVEVLGRTPGNAATGVERLPSTAGAGNGLSLRPGTEIRVVLRQSIDSGHVRNGDMIDGTLAAPLAGLPVGTPVRLTVVAATPAGQMFSYGVLSLQLVSVADRRVLSEVITAQGKEGAKEMPDAAPARGTEAIFATDQPFSVPAA